MGKARSCVANWSRGRPWPPPHCSTGTHLPIPRAGCVNSIHGVRIISGFHTRPAPVPGASAFRLSDHISRIAHGRRHVLCQNLPLPLVMLCCGMGEGSRWWTDLFFKLKHEGCRVTLSRTLVRFNAGCWTAPHMTPNAFTVLIHSRAPGACRDSTVASCHAVA